MLKPEMIQDKKFIFALLTSLLSGFFSSVYADRQSLASIVLQTESFLAEYPYDTPYPPRFEVSSLDQRLKLTPCQQALNVRFSRTEKTMGNTSLSVRCEKPVQWQIHLPVRVDIYDDVIVNKTPLTKGQLIDARHLKTKKHNISDLFQGFFRNSDPLMELEPKRNLAANTILNPTNLQPRKLVTSGQKVTIILNLQGLQVKSSGLALQSASLGQVIKVRNTQSNKVVEGIVSAAGQIRVEL